MGIQERKEREREQRKDCIIECATKIFLAKGFIHASMDEIAECAELSKATLYLYFKNKEEVILQVMNSVMSKLIEYLESRMAGAETADGKIRMIVEAYIDFNSECNAQYVLLISKGTTAGMNFVNLDGYQEYENQYNKFWDILLAPIIVAIEEGFFRMDCSSVEIAVTLWSAIKGVMQNMDKVVKTQNCEEYRQQIEQNLVTQNEFQQQLYALDHKKMLRHLSNSIISSFQKIQK